MRLQLQSLIFEKYGAGANDLADGDSGVDGRAVRRRRLADNNAGADADADASAYDDVANKRKKQKQKQIVELHG